jgi:predicted nucleic acid-binding Zn ribbon protein
MSRRAPRPLAPALAALADSVAPRTLLADVLRVWPEVAGPAIAREATPSAARDGVVTISCSGSVWAQELDLMAVAFIERLNAALGDDQVRRLRCRALPPIKRS